MERRKYVVEELLQKNYVLPQSNKYVLRENAVEGKSTLEVSLSEENYCIEDYDHSKKCAFFVEDGKIGMQKSVDHVLLEKRADNKWILHLIEMKSSVGNKTWRDIKQKVRTSYLSMEALAAVMGIEVEEIKTYTTYENEKFNSGRETTNPRMIVPPLGEPAIDFKKEEWDKNIIRIKVGDEITFSHKGIKMENIDNVLQGKISLGIE